MSRPTLLLLLVLTAACQAPATPDPSPATGVAADVAYLASPALGGRAAGTEGDDSAALFIARRYQSLGLNGAFRSRCITAPRCAAAYFQLFTVNRDVRGHNVGAVVAGTDSTCADRYVVVGAHYDHLGNSPLHALDPEAGFALRPGADDNASGTAAVLELARRLVDRPPPCPVLLVDFDAEELGEIGSRVFVEHLPVARQNVMLMINLDMVGRLRTGGLIVDPSELGGGDEGRSVRTLVDSTAKKEGIRLRYSSETAGRSDHASFGNIGVPAVALFTGFHPDYHRTSDVASRVDAAGIERVVDVTEALIRADGDRMTGAQAHR